MKYRAFGSTDLQVSEIGLGCARLGGVFQGASKAELLGTIRAALDAGITFFDTADIYAQGESERLLGEALRGARQRVVIATKAGYCLPAQRRLISGIKPLLRPVVRLLRSSRHRLPGTVRGALTQDFSPDALVSALDASLRRLRTDYVDVFQLHSPPRDVLESGAFLEPLERLQRQGKVRAFGVACEHPEDALLCLRYPQVSVVQLSLNLLKPEALAAALPRCRERGTAVIARQCFASGLLTLSPGPLQAHADDPDEDKRREAADVLTLDGIAGGFGRPLRQAALHYVLQTPGVSVTLVGMRTVAHVAECMDDLAAPPLSDAELTALGAVRTPAGVGLATPA